MTHLAEQAAGDELRVSAVQCAPEHGDVTGNLERTIALLEGEARAEVALAVFPECTLTGYIYRSRGEAAEVAETVPGPSSQRLLAACHDLQIYTVFGLVERDGDHLYNCAILAGPDRFLAKYRKTHLPRVGIDRHVDPGNLPFEVHRTTIGPIGMLICYDHRFPEAIRCLALDGMAILAHPTNWPTGMNGEPGSRPSPEPFDYRARMERIITISADRCGTERGVEFVGGSFIAIPSGEIVARAPYGESAVIRAVVHPSKTASKANRAAHLDLESDLHADRRPELYRRLTDVQRGQ